MTITRSTQSLRRLHRVLITVLVIVCTAVSLLLAHASTAPNSIEVVHSAESSLISDSVAVTGPGGDGSLGLVKASVAEDLLPVGIAICVSLGFACGLALLVLLYRLVARPSWPQLQRLLRLASPAPIVSTPRVPVTLTSLCISQV